MLNFLLVSVFVNCVALAAPVPRDARKTELYFPTTVGTEWVYGSADSKEDEFADTLEITEAEESDGATVVTVVRSFHRRPQSTETIRVSSAGLFLLANDHGKHDPPACVLKLPCAAGDRWRTYCLPLKPNPGYVNVVVNEEQVKVPAGTFNAIRVDTEFTLEGETKRVYTHWYAPDVGVVKYEIGEAFGGKGQTVLKSFKLGKK
jgi:hypothetical protein